MLLARILPFVISNLSLTQPLALQNMEKQRIKENRQLHICNPEFIVKVDNETLYQSFRSTCMQVIHDKGFRSSWTEWALQYNGYHAYYCVLINN